MNDIDKRLADLCKYVESLVNDEGLDWESKKRFHAILCQLNMIGKDLEEYHLVKKCRCCCSDET